MTHVGDGADEAIDGVCERVDLARDVVASTPFLLLGSLAEVVEKILCLRDELGVSHFVVRDPEGFAPVVDVLAGT